VDDETEFHCNGASERERFAPGAPPRFRGGPDAKALVVTRTLIYRNALSAILFVVAVVGIVVKLGEVRHGIVDGTTRFVLAGYMVVALYALASIAARVNAARSKP
jgi:hypothetical protein